MGPLAAVERFLERLFERQAARFFKTAIRPIQVQRRLERAMEGSRVRDGARTLVPHRFTVRLAPADLSAIRSAAPSLAADLADGALAFARGHGYSLLDRPTVALRSDPSVELGDIAIDAVEPARRGAEADDAGLDRGRADPSGLVDDGDPDDALDASPPVLPEAGRVQAPGAAATAPRAGSAGGSADQTAVFVVPSSDGPRAIIRETRADGSSRTIAFDGRPMTIGRAPDNRLVLRDGRASRHHARIDGRRGTLVLSDLGSTNGSFVNDRRVDSVALGAGDRIRIGATALVVEAVGDEVDVEIADREGGQPPDGPSATGRGSSDASVASHPNPS
jgi:FHA domain-containing protein